MPFQRLAGPEVIVPNSHRVPRGSARTLQRHRGERAAAKAASRCRQRVSGGTCLSSSHFSVLKGGNDVIDFRGCEAVLESRHRVGRPF